MPDAGGDAEARLRPRLPLEPIPIVGVQGAEHLPHDVPHVLVVQRLKRRPEVEEENRAAPRGACPQAAGCVAVCPSRWTA